MNEEIDLNVKAEFITNYKDAYPLISKESIVDWSKLNQEGTILKLVDAKNKFIAKGGIKS